MSFSYHRSTGDDESVDDSDVLDPTHDLNSSSARIPLIPVPIRQEIVPPPSPSPIPYHVPSPTNLGFGSVSPPERPFSVLSGSTEDWIQRQQPVQVSQSDLRRYHTRRVRLYQGGAFSADYPFYPLF